MHTFEHSAAAAGTSPGRLVETDADYNIIHEWPEDVAGTLNILGEQFNPHGLSIDWDKGLILTSDFFSPITILKPSLGIEHANTLRLWNLASRTIISTITIPDVSIAMLEIWDQLTRCKGWWNPRRQVYSRQQEINSPCHCGSPRAGLDHLSVSHQRRRHARCR